MTAGSPITTSSDRSGSLAGGPRLCPASSALRRAQGVVSLPNHAGARLAFVGHASLQGGAPRMFEQGRRCGPIAISDRTKYHYDRFANRTLRAQSA